jgi:hypothetical protein
MPNSPDTIVLFDGPCQTQFLLESLSLRVLCANATEATIPFSDFLAFLLTLDSFQTFSFPFTAKGRTQFLIDGELAEISRGSSLAVFPLEDLQAFLEHLAQLDEQEPLFAGIRKPVVAHAIRQITHLFQALDFLRVRGLQRRPPLDPEAALLLSLGGRELRYRPSHEILALLQLRLRELFLVGTGPPWMERWGGMSGQPVGESISPRRAELDRLVSVAHSLFAKALATPQSVRSPINE